MLPEQMTTQDAGGKRQDRMGIAGVYDIFADRAIPTPHVIRPEIVEDEKDGNRKNQKCCQVHGCLPSTDHPYGILLPLADFLQGRWAKGLQDQFGILGQGCQPGRGRGRQGGDIGQDRFR